MQENQPHNNTNSSVKKRKNISGNGLFLIIAVTAIAGFFIGSRSDQIFALVSPVFGIKSYSGQINTDALQQTYQALKANYDGTLDDAKLIEGASKGLVDAAGDEYTTYFNAVESSEFQDDLSGTIGGGIGAELGLRDGNVTILRTLADNPAQKVGLLAGDVIVGVNDQSSAGWTVEKAVSQVRGEAKTSVKLVILRAGESKEFTVVREVISNPSVSSSIEGKVGTLTISRFDSETGSRARAVANDFVSKGVTSIILDLRGNGGGYVDAAQDVAGLWLDDKVILVEKTNGKVVDEIRTGRNAIFSGFPTVVLVNEGSASASEIVAGALQDYNIAKLVGKKTFGKGSVQKLIDLPDGAQLKVTIAKWFTPKGKNINKDGIEPNITAELTAENVNAGVDPQLEAAKKSLGI